MSEEVFGRVPQAEPGSRASTEPQSSQRLGPTGFDPARGPRRSHSLIASIGADTMEDLIWSLRGLADDAMRGKLSTNCCSGSPSVGFMYSYRHDAAQTHDRYFQEIDAWLARNSDAQTEGPAG